MHPHRSLPLIAVALLLGAAPAEACTLNLNDSGELGTLVGNDTQIGSQIGGGTRARLTTLLPLLSGVTIEVGAPVLVDHPANYNAGTSTVEVSYDASILNVLAIRHQDYTAGATSFPTGVLGAVTVTLDLQNRVTNSTGLPAGTYRTRTTITCHP